MRLTGVIWLFAASDDYARASFPHVAATGARLLELSPADAAGRWPQMSFEGVRNVILEEKAGVLMARQACAAVVERFQSLGGTCRQAELAPLALPGAAGAPLRLADGSELRADQYVLACGPWLGRLLPDVVGDRVRVTRQEVFFFGTPAGDTRFDEGVLPIWLEMNGRIVYGIPGNQGRGFKIADDTRGAPFDPTSGDRTPSAEGIAQARRVLARRFPTLAGAPLLESRVCQYENTPDSDFILDRHPARADVWILGGGSGHAFKMGPAIGLHAARAVLGQSSPEPALALGRFS
jgi:glycine/D-amino acid oxidase-like deaminating enzyme